MGGEGFDIVKRLETSAPFSFSSTDPVVLVSLRPMAPRFFASSAAWRKWLHAHHAKQTELLVGFYKRDSGRPCMTWSESVDEALCYGWIDGVRKSIDDTRYSIRFSVRKPTSIWSKVNIAKAEALIASGRMMPAGLEKFQRRTSAKSGVYAFEQGEIAFDAPTARIFQADRAAWEFFQKQGAYYRKRMTWWVINARRPETRQKRLAKLIEASHGQTKIP